MRPLEIKYSHPNIEDGGEIFRLIKSSPPLDVNSQYYYHVICHDFSSTCVIARQQKKIIGFISAYLKPEKPTCLFVWQVAVAPEARGLGLASNMLQWLTMQLKYPIKSLETTISPANTASQKLFRRFATKHNANCFTTSFLGESHFDSVSHEEEVLYKISPLNL